MSTLAVILPAAGKSTRFANLQYKKVFAPLAGLPVWLRTATIFQSVRQVKQIILVVSPEDYEPFVKEFQDVIQAMKISVTLGGIERFHSVQNGLDLVHPDIDWVAVHDAARPLVEIREIENVIAAARKTGAAILASPIYSTIKKVVEGSITQTVDRNGLYTAQTPQIFKKRILVEAFNVIQKETPADQIASITDEAQAVSNNGGVVSVVDGSPANIKITTAADLTLANALLEARSSADSPPQ